MDTNYVKRGKKINVIDSPGMGMALSAKKNHIAIGIWLCLEKKSFPLSKVSYDMNAKNSFVINRSVKLYNPHLALNSLTFSKKLIGCEEYAMAYMNISLIQ